MRRKVGEATKGAESERKAAEIQCEMSRLRPPAPTQPLSDMGKRERALVALDRLFDSLLNGETH